MDSRRRIALKAGASFGMIGVALGASLLPETTFAAWPAKAFRTHDLKQALSLEEGANAVEMDHVTVTAPEIAENGATVPVSVKSSLPDVVAISLFAEKNPFPFNSEYELGENTLPYVATRIRLSETQHVMAVVRTAGGKLYGGKALVKVTLGGCGG